MTAGAMRALGLDPGASTGFAVIERIRCGCGVHVASGVLGRDARAHQLDLLLDVHRPELVGIEEPSGYAFAAARVKDLLEASRITGELAATSRARGYRVVTASAAAWRKALCGRGSATDAAVKQMLGLRVAELPTRTSTHARDAAGVAIWALITQRLDGARIDRRAAD